MKEYLKLKEQYPLYKTMFMYPNYPNADDYNVGSFGSVSIEEVLIDEDSTYILSRDTDIVLSILFDNVVLDKYPDKYWEMDSLIEEEIKDAEEIAYKQFKDLPWLKVIMVKIED